MAQVKFIATNATNFTSITPDEGTLYFLSDTHQIYKGSQAYSGACVKSVTSFPATGEVNTLYINTANNQVKFYNGSTYVDVIIPAQSISTSDNGFATAAQVANYVKDVSGDVESLKSTVAGHTTDISDLKSKDEELAGDIATNASDISAISGNITTLASRVSTAENDIDALETAVGTINGTGAGSIAKALSDAKAYTDTLSNGAVATNTSDITGLKTSVGNLQNDKADKATTLEGYGIADAYTKTQTDSAIATAVANSEHLKREIVTSLPDASNADAHTIYMVSKTDGSGNQKYDEYMLVNGAFEKIGDSAVDLTNYATKDYADNAASNAASTAKSEAITAAGAAADTKISTAIGALDKVDSAVSGQYVSSVSETDGIISVTRADLPTYTLATGSANGTVAFNGTDVAVKGLGSAAYTASNAYDTAGTAATKADAALESAKAYTDSALEWGTL